MKHLSIFAAAMLCLSAITGPGLSADTEEFFDDSSSSDIRKSLGDFALIGRSKHHSVILQNNVIYEPTSRHYEKKTLDWVLGDTIRVLTTSHHHIFGLVNLRTGESIKTRVIKFT